MSQRNPCVLWMVKAEDFPEANEILKTLNNQNSMGAQTVRMDASLR